MYILEEPNEGQQKALDMVDAFLKSDSRVAVLTGFAGTGKTACIGLIAHRFGTPTVLAPTGKAALRVADATGIPASTIHRYLYIPETDPKTGAPVWVIKPRASFEDSGLIIIDESSMIDKKVWIDLNSIMAHIGVFGRKVLLIGDPAQLPPVAKSDEEAFSALTVETPFRVHLSEIHRQAEGSPIIQASMTLRTPNDCSKALSLLTPLGASKFIDTVISQQDADLMVICYTNKRRHWINNEVRKALGYNPGTLQDGEKLLILQNNYDIGRYNGEIIKFEKWDAQPDINEIVSDRYTTSTIEMNFGVGVLEGHDKVTLSPDEVCGKTEGATVGNWAIRKYARYAYQKISRNLLLSEAPPHLHANYGYALSCHKAQGSQAKEVLVVLDSSFYRMPYAARSQWAYTAFTRGQDLVRYVYLPDMVE